MRLLGLVAFAVLAAATATARADGIYLSEGFGVTHVGDELGQRIPRAQGAFHITFGFRTGHWSYELLGGGTFSGVDSIDSPPPPSLATLGVGVKYSTRLSRHLELYAEGNASEGRLAGEGVDGYAGRGLGASAGLVFKGRGSVLGLLAWPLFFTNIGPKMTGALYVEDGYDFYRFHRGVDDPAIDAQVTHWSFGIAAGSDF